MDAKDKVRNAVDRARQYISSGEGYLALGQLASVQTEVEEAAGTPLWAEHALIYAGALAATSEAGVEEAFEAALARVYSLTPDHPALQLRAEENFGKYLALRRAFNRARDHYRAAERIAQGPSGCEEDAARLQMRMIRLDLDAAEDPKVREAFRRLKEASRDGYTCVEQLETWIRYDEIVRGYGRQLVAARKGGEPTADFFRALLGETRRRRRDEGED